MAKQRACLALPESVQEIDTLAGLKQPEVKEPMMRRKGNYRILVLAVALLLGTQAPLGATTIDTYTGWNKSSFILTFGPDNTPTYGQTITVPFGESALTSFTFYLEVAPTVIFRGEVYAWDSINNMATGPCLYQSDPTHTTQGGNFEAVTFNTGLTSVISGHTYGLFATTSKDTGSGSGVWGLAGDVYSGGGFIHTNNNDYSQWTTEAWEPLRLSDLAFQATFGITPIPLPGTLLLFGSGLAGLAWPGRRRRAGK